MGLYGTFIICTLAAAIIITVFTDLATAVLCGIVIAAPKPLSEGEHLRAVHLPERCKQLLRRAGAEH
jgi:MFS superfamily sulfate permease-like transporter